MEDNSTMIKELKENIKKQRKINLELFSSIPIPSHEDPCNKKAEPILEQWRLGSIRLKKLLKELQELELNSKVNINKSGKESKIFVNGFGEATKRNITCGTYERSEKRISKEILSFIF